MASNNPICALQDSIPCEFKIDLNGDKKLDTVVVRNSDNETEVTAKLHGAKDEVVLYRSPPEEKEASLKKKWLSLIGASDGVGVKLHLVNLFKQVSSFIGRKK